MIGELMCPECGGVVGATETTEAGPPCRCFTASNDASDTITDAPPPVDEAPVVKVCRVCGKNLTGHKRVKDSQGYWCMDCVKEDEKKLHGGRIRCKVCGHLTKEENLLPYEGTKMCPRCRQERQDIKKQEIKRMGFKAARTRAEVQQIYGLAIIVLILLSVIGYGVYRFMHPH
jgi:DNA-directed RNA polymerase subunit RPC12/RpoP